MSRLIFILLSLSVAWAASEPLKTLAEVRALSAEEAAKGDQAVSRYLNLRPDVVTMDFKLPDRDGDQVISEIRAEFPDARVVLLSIFENPESIWRATEAGVLGYVSKAAEIEEIVTDLEISISTVKHHLERIFVKLGASDRTQAATAAVQRGLVRLDE